MYASNAFNGFAVFLTLLFGYMTVAYVVGLRLTKFQVTAITLLYCVTETMLMLSVLGQTHSAEILVARYPDFNYSPLQTTPFTLPSVVINIAAILMSLLFMFDIRRKARKGNEQNT